MSEEEKGSIGKFFDNIGAGTATGAALGGGAMLLFTMFSSKEGKEAPGFWTSLLTIAAGVVAGGLAGDFIKKDGPVFSPDPAPDGSKVVKRSIDTDSPPGSGKTVELDYHEAYRNIASKMKGPEAERFRSMDSLVKDISKTHRILLKTGDESPTTATFTGMYLPGLNGLRAFDKPIEMPIKDGKVDYAVTTVLSLMRVAEKEGKAGYQKIKDLEELKKDYAGKLNDLQAQEVRTHLLLARMAKDGRISEEAIKAIKNNAINTDGTLNVNYLQQHEAELGIDSKRVAMMAPHGDNLNLAFGRMGADETRITVDHTIVLDVKKLGEQVRTGPLAQLATGMVDNKKEFDFGMLSAMSKYTGGGMDYRKLEKPVEIAAYSDGRLGIGEFNDTVKKANEPAPASQEPVVPSVPSKPAGTKQK